MFPRHLGAVEKFLAGEWHVQNCILWRLTWWHFQDWLAWSLYCDRTDCGNATLKYGSGNENRKEEIDLRDPWQWNYGTWLLNIGPEVRRCQRWLQMLWAWMRNQVWKRKNVLTVSGLLLSPRCCESCNRLHSKNLRSKFKFHID